MAEQVFDQEFNFFNIIPFSPGDEELLAQEIVEYVERTGCRNVLYSLTLSPSGAPAMGKVHFMLESYKKLKANLAGSRARLGVLFQAVLGHGARNFPPAELKSRPIEPWVRMVNVEGNLTRYCPLDPGFRKYIFDMTVLFAKEEPCFILGDDDIRSFAPKAECFCELHTAEFNRMTGKNFTPEEYRQAVINSKIGDEVYNAYEILRQGIPNTVATIIREAVDSVDPEIRCGSCMPGWEYLFNGDTARCFAGKHAPVMRIANSNYNEGAAKHYPYLVVKTQAMRNAHKDIPIVLDEADTCPHNLWSRAAISFHAKLCSSIFAGVNGAKVWYVNTHKGSVPISRNYTDIMAENRGLYQTLAAEVKKTVPTGVIIPAHKNFAEWHAAHYDELSPKLTLIPLETMATVELGQIGIPFKASFDYDENEVYAVAGADSINHLTDEELRKLLGCKLLLDGPAAVAVCKRGYAEVLGIEAEHKELPYNREIRTDGSGKGYVTVMNKMTPLFTIKEKSVEVLTEFYYGSYPGSNDLEYISPATVFYENSFGGKVCCMAFHHAISFSQFNVGRRDLLIEIIEKLKGSKMPLICTSEQNVTVITREYEDGSLLAEVCNINFDPLKTIELRCAKTPEKIEYLTGVEGAWQEIPFRVEGDKVFIDYELACYELAVLKIR